MCVSLGVHLTLNKGVDDTSIRQEAASAEDVDIADADGDGWLDIIVACELAHLIYFRNPTLKHLTSKWERTIPEITLNRGSFIRVFFADFDGDDKVEVVAANKGGWRKPPTLITLL